ncbi:hypothetical protein [Luteococcus peritonei]|uniref:DUF222 domain-containing protein n=1 Tax=Luteococcus peritonei TaxID=88874 RepID=A0ABW4RYD0_9ACTN
MPGLRPSEADRLARHLLVDDPGDLAASVMGLVYVVDAASQRAGQDAGDVASILEVSGSALTHVLQSRSWKTEVPAPAMVAVADAIGQMRPGHGVERELVHVAYLAAHATSRVATTAGNGEVLGAVRAVELGLDAALHGHAPGKHRSDVGSEFSTAVMEWARAVDRCAQRPSVMTQLVTARAAGSVLVAVDAIAQAQATRSTEALVDYSDAIKPALARSLWAWGEQHRQWAKLMSPGERVDPDLMAATTRLMRASRDVPVGRGESRSWDAAVTALSLTRHTAAVSSQPVHPGALKAPAELVAPMLAAALPPNGSELQVAWLKLERLEGRANVTVPEPVLAKLAAVGSATLRGADRALQSSYLMMGPAAAPTTVPAGRTEAVPDLPHSRLGPSPRCV